jgi:membrane protease subunit (stomatin/prohibitin family)
MGRSSESMAHSLSDVGYRSAREKALAEALALATERYVECSACHKGVCLDCIDDERHVCLSCAGRQRFEAAAGGNEASRAAAATCPSCHHPHPGGRFCPECGFDMASTHKTCPGCGAMAARQARFCVDCGHAF